jgi:hypothetical protein
LLRRFAPRNDGSRFWHCRGSSGILPVKTKTTRGQEMLT